MSTFLTAEGIYEIVCFGLQIDAGGVKYWTKSVRDLPSERVSDDEMMFNFQKGYLFGIIQRYV